MKSITLGLIKRRDLRRGIICNDSDLNQITTNIAMQMFTPADLKLEFEMNARPFWREWDRFEYLISKVPRGAEYLDAALTILHTHGEEGIHRVSELQSLFELDPNKISQDLLHLMCTTTIAKDMEEEELLHRREEVETALTKFQRYFFQDRVFKTYGHFSDSSNLIPTVHIKVYQGKEYQAFCEQWRDVSLTNSACYKVQVKFVHSSGIEEKDTQDAQGLRNSWLTSCWKQFISMPFVSHHLLFQKPTNRTILVYQS